MNTRSFKPAFLGGLTTTFTLFGGLLLGIVLGNVVFNAMPNHSLTSLDPLAVTLATIPALGGLVAGGALWGVLMGRLARAANPRRMAVAGALGFAPITIALAFGLLVLEPIAVERLGAQFPIHRLFTFFFVPTAFLIAGVGAWAIGLGLQNGPLAWSLLWRAGLAAALAFLAVNLVMEASGWVVGAPGAVERLTMLTVMFAGDLAAALVAGAVVGSMLFGSAGPNSFGGRG
jgi:hypothetical protein